MLFCFHLLHIEKVINIELAIFSMLKYERISLAKVYKLCKELAAKVVKKTGKNSENFILVAISRGGLVPARLLADILNKNEVQCICAHSYTGIGKAKKQVKITQFPNADLANKELLVVDDIADSGHTLALVKKMLEHKGAHVLIATLHYKPRSAIKPDFFVEQKPNTTWIVYPWEIHEFKKMTRSKAN